MYNPTSPPGSSTAETLWIYHELLTLAGILQNLERGQFLPELTSAPPKPKERQLIFADGTHWNPGSGKGVYVYYGSAWHFLG